MFQGKIKFSLTKTPLGSENRNNNNWKAKGEALEDPWSGPINTAHSPKPLIQSFFTELFLIT